MTPDTKKQLAQMGDITANKEKLRKALEEAKKNPNDPRSAELRRRLERGMFNKELEALGKKPFPVQMPKIDMKAAMAGVKQEEGVQSIVPEKKDGFIMEPLKDLAGGLVKGGQEFMKGGEKIVETAMRPDRSLAEKATMIGGTAFKAGSGGVGELLLGGIKALPGITPEIEQATADLVQKAVSGVAETELVQDYTRWYSGLDPRVRDQVDAVGGFASGLLDLIGLKTGEAGAKVVKQGLEASTPAIRQAGDVVTDIPRAVGEAVDAFSEARRPARIAKQEARVEEAVGRITQAGSDQRAIEQATRALSEVDTTGVRTYEDLNVAIDDKITALANRVNAELDKDVTVQPADRWVKSIKVGNQTVTQNPIGDALDGLERAYQLSGEVANATRIQQLRSKFESEGFTLREANDLAREYGTEFRSRAFNAMGDPKDNFQAENFENVRKSIKDVVREKMPNDVTRELDRKMSDLYSTKTYTEKIENNVAKLQQRIKNRTLAQKVGGAAAQLVDLASFGSLRGFIAKLLPSNMGNKAMNSLEIEAELRKNLAQIEKLNRIKGDAEFDKALEDFAEQLALPPGQTDVPTTYGNTPIEVGGTDPLGRPIQPGGTERVAPDATINRTDSEPNVPPVKQIQDATDEATSQVETEMTELSRAGQRIPVLDRSGSIVGFKADPSTFPKWVPENLRTTELFTRVWNNINAGRAPRANATNEMELQRILEAKIKERADQILSNPKKDAGIFDNNVPFALALMAGGTYYYFSEDGSALPLVAIGMMSPAARKGAVKQLDDMIADARKAANSADATPAQRRAYEKTVNQLTKQKANIIEEANQPK